MKLNANTEGFEVVEFLGKRALFTSMRIDRETVPDGAYCYDVRHADEDGMVAAEIKPYVMVNHMGSILMAEPLKMVDSGCLILDDDINFVEGHFTLAEFMAAENAAKQNLQMGGQSL